MSFRQMGRDGVKQSEITAHDAYIKHIALDAIANLSYFMACMKLRMKFVNGKPSAVHR